MPTLLDEWQRMRSGAGTGTGSGYALELRVSRSDIRAYLALQEPGLVPALLIDLPATIRPRSLTSFTTRAFEVVLAVFPGLPAAHIGVAVNLLDPTFDDLFAAFAGEMLSAVSASTTPEQAVQAINRCIARWRRFVDSGRRSLSDEEVRGLIGELAVLGRVARQRGFLNALSAWRAPFDSIRDFEFESSSLEVKTYQVHVGPSLRINDPAQLEPSPGRPLHLCAVRLAPTETGRTLPEVIQLLTDIHSGQPGGVVQLEEALASYGYLQSQARTFSDRFSIGPISVFAVGDGFPRIRPVDVPAGVEDVRFSLPIGGIARFEVPADQVLGPPVAGLEAVP
ncbi:MAG: PD-(D/E)XK motif protein [Phycisphaerales bacterium]|nr:PD-(D/E)XK motif protein [Phycisphaerales bacterium]